MNEKLIGLDIGTTTTISHSKNKSYIVESRVTTFKDTDELSNKDIIEVEGKKFIVGKGEFENNIYKYEKENFNLLFKYAVGKAVPNNSLVNGIIGIPVNQFDNPERKKELMATIKKNKEFTIKINGTKKDIQIGKLLIRPEGYPIYEMTKSLGALKNGLPTLVFDIGGGTSDASEYDENGLFTGGTSFNIGLHDLYREVSNYVINDNKTWSDFSIEKAKSLCDGSLQLDIDLSKCYKNIFKKLNNELIGYRPSYTNYNVILCGGGAKYFKKYFSNTCRYISINEDITSNAKGFYLLAEEKFKNEKRN